MADEERDAGLSTTDDEMDASDDTNQYSSDGGVNGADNASSSSDGLAYGRVTPRDKIVTCGSDDDAPADIAAETGDSGDDSNSDTGAAPDDTDNSATNSDADPNDEPHLLADGEHTPHVPGGTHGNSNDESANNVGPDVAANGANPALIDEDEMGSVAPSSVSAEGADFNDGDVDGLVGEALESDQEMPLTTYIEGMICRLAVVLGITGAITLVLFPGADILNVFVDTQAAFGVHTPSVTDVINFLWNPHIPGVETAADRRPRLYGPLELILAKPRVTGLTGTVIGLPVFVYETHLLIRPGLYPKKRKYYLAVVLMSLVLALVGVLFAHFVVPPVIFAYSTSYTGGTVVVAFGLREMFSLVPILMGYMTVVFRIPLFVELAIVTNFATRRWPEDRRLLFWGAFLGPALLVSPDPTGAAPIIIGATMTILFGGTPAASRWTGN